MRACSRPIKAAGWVRARSLRIGSGVLFPATRDHARHHVFVSCPVALDTSPTSFPRIRCRRVCRWLRDELPCECSAFGRIQREARRLKTFLDSWIEPRHV